VLEVSAVLVHLVDEADARHFVLVALAPHGLVCGCTPETESNSATAPSSTRRLRSTSAVNPRGRGVDDVDEKSRHMQVVAAEVIVMPRSCSCSM